MPILNMRQRIRAERPKNIGAVGEIVSVPDELWDDVGQRDNTELCTIALAEKASDGIVIVGCLDQKLQVDLNRRTICRWCENQWQPVEDSLLELIAVIYLRNATSEPVTQVWVGVNDLKDAHFFQGPHALRTGALLKRFGTDAAAFGKAAERLGGTALDMGDAAYRLRTFPKIPVAFVLWEGDEEFNPNLTILFDRSIDKHLPADGIWGVVNWTSKRLLQAAMGME